jgi:hypothetical protein
MNINKSRPTGQFNNKIPETNLKKETEVAIARSGEGALSSRSADASFMIEGLNRLSPVEQYSYFDLNGKNAANIKLEAVPGNPQKTISRANRVINRAIMPPAVGNPQRQQLPEAIRLKHAAKSQLDKVA